MALRLYNTRTRTVEPFVPLTERSVRVYVCGLTPSAEAHLGHARSFLFFDVLRRYLVASGYALTFVRNITDIDDRSIARGRESGIPWTEIVQGFIDSFDRSMVRLGVRPPDIEPRVTAYIPEILAMIEALVERDFAYATEDGVYYRVRSFPRYGALSNRSIDELLSGARIAVDEHKTDALDFALWKFAKPGEPAWESKWGPGRPGWHIECSAMIHEIFGEPFDIHGGGFDLIFPHHENEIAQTEALYPPRMANVWMHGGLLMFDNRKMSKSIGNFEPLSTLLDRHDPLAIRLLFLQTGYRKPMNFTEESITSAETALERLVKAYHGLQQTPESATVEPFRERFYAALDDDINTSGALSVLFDLTKERFTADLDAARAFVREALDILGIADALDRSLESAPVRVDPAVAARLAQAVGDVVHVNGNGPEATIDAIVAARNAARKDRDFKLADRLRLALADEHIVLMDNKDGTTNWSATTA